MAQCGLRAGSGLTLGFAATLTGIHWSLGINAAVLLLATLALLKLGAGVGATLSKTGGTVEKGLT